LFYKISFCIRIYCECGEIYISQGSVATQLRCAGIFSNQFITNFPQNVPVKNFENRSTFGEDMDKSMWLSFLAHPHNFYACYFSVRNVPFGLRLNVIDNAAIRCFIDYRFVICRKFCITFVCKLYHILVNSINRIRIEKFEKVGRSPLVLSLFPLHSRTVSSILFPSMCFLPWKCLLNPPRRSGAV